MKYLHSKWNILFLYQQLHRSKISKQELKIAFDNLIKFHLLPFAQLIELLQVHAVQMRTSILFFLQQYQNVSLRGGGTHISQNQTLYNNLYIKKLSVCLLTRHIFFMEHTKLEIDIDLFRGNIV